MSNSLDAAAVLDREFLQIRARILEIAAALDRMNRAEGTLDNDARWKMIQVALAVLEDKQASRAERIQLIFSLPYDPEWRRHLGMPH